MSDLAFITCE